MMNEVVVFLGLLGAGVFVWTFNRYHELRSRQMQHEERITAMQKGIEIPHLPQGLEGTQAPLNGGRRVWFRLTILGLAIVSFFGGAGLVLSFRLVDDPEFSRMWGMGLIPVMVSVGLFLFWLAAGRELKKLERPSE